MCYVMWQVADRIKVGNQGTLRWGDYFGLSWAQCSREFKSKSVLKYDKSLTKGRECLEYDRVGSTWIMKILIY